MKADLKGTKVAYYRTSQKLTLQLFDRPTATLADRIELSKDSFNFGYFDFSPDGEKLYVQVYYPGVPDTMPAIFQYDLSVWSANTIESTRTAVAFAPQFQGGWLKLGPDGRIYSALGAPDSTHIGVFTDPNAGGIACGFAPYSVALPVGITKAEIGSSAICLWWPAEWPLTSIHEAGAISSKLSFQPNPACDAVAIVFKNGKPTDGSVTVSDMSGREVMRSLLTASSTLRLDVADLERGCYMVRHVAKDRSCTSGKLMIE